MSTLIYTNSLIMWVVFTSCRFHDWCNTPRISMCSRCCQHYQV